METGVREQLDRDCAELTDAKVGATCERHVEDITIGRAATSEDVAGFASHLASPDPDYMTHRSPLIDGSASTAD